jgi:2-amino-4-hydroxy-6-hydroxymethyldihydropteridine diphosphokinase
MHMSGSYRTGRGMSGDRMSEPEAVEGRIPSAGGAPEKPRGELAAYVACGSNLGDRDGYLDFAARMLHANERVRVCAVSRVYETDPLGPPPQGPYLNAVLELRTGLPARELLELLLEVERKAGRRRGRRRWEPRTLDLDLLLYGDREIQEPGLSVPHPRLQERAFVLEPLAELASELLHPVLGLRIAELARRQRDPRAVRPWPRAIPVP